MKLLFASKKLEKQCADSSEMQKAFGERAKKIKLRLQELRAASNLEEMRSLPQANCHELKGNRSGQLAVDISGNWRIVFEPNHDPIPRKEDGGLDWEEVTIIEIAEIADYH